MRSTLLTITFLLIFSFAQAQSGKYHFTLSSECTYLTDSLERDSVLQRLDGFLLNIKEPFIKNPFVDTGYARKNINPFENLYNDAVKALQDSLYKPVIMAILPIAKHQQYVIKIGYLDASAGQQAKLNLICTVVAKKRKGNYYIYNAIEYNTRNWNKRQIGSIKYIYPNKLNLAKARQMDRINHQLANKFRTKVIPITYYRCENPEQLFKTMGYDYLYKMYISSSAGLAEYWANTLLAGNNSELYVHEAVHFYTGKLFPHFTSIMNEGYATYLGGSGGRSLKQLTPEIKQFIEQHPDMDITDAFINFYRITYVVSGLICKDMETKYGFKKITEMFDAANEDQYFKTLEKITGVTRQQFPAYVKKLVGVSN